MRSRKDRERQGARFAVLAAILLALFMTCTQPAALNVVVGRGAVSVEMKVAFFEMSFDFGQSRSKTNSAMVIL